MTSLSLHWWVSSQLPPISVGDFLIQALIIILLANLMQREIEKDKEEQKKKKRGTQGGGGSGKRQRMDEAEGTEEAAPVVKELRSIRRRGKLDNTWLGRFQLGKFISSGAYGQIYALKNDMVIKVMSDLLDWSYEVAMHDAVSQRAPYAVISLVDYGEGELEDDEALYKYWYIVFPRLSSSFSSAIPRHVKRVDQIFSKFADCWTQGIYHFDVKSENILATTDACMYLHDWGASCIWLDDAQGFHFFDYNLFLYHARREKDNASPLANFLLRKVLIPYATTDPRRTMEWISLIGFRSLFGYQYKDMRFNGTRFAKIYAMDEELRKANVIRKHGYEDWEHVFMAISLTICGENEEEAEAEETAEEAKEARMKEIVIPQETYV